MGAGIQVDADAGTYRNDQYAGDGDEDISTTKSRGQKTLIHDFSFLIRRADARLPVERQGDADVTPKALSVNEFA
jgi:hypothetical protein